jgi:hypothetical protein
MPTLAKYTKPQLIAHIAHQDDLLRAAAKALEDLRLQVSIAKSTPAPTHTAYWEDVKRIKAEQRAKGLRTLSYPDYQTWSAQQQALQLAA